MTDILIDLSNCGLPSEEAFGNLIYCGTIVADGPILSKEIFGTSSLFETPPTLIQVESIFFDDELVTIPMPLCIFTWVIDVTGYSISSQENFTPIYLPISIPSTQTFGRFNWHMLVSNVAVPSTEENIGRLKITNVLLKSFSGGEKFGIPNVATLQDRPSLDLMVANQFPAFVQEDHPRFIKFMQAYYAWMESADYPLYQSKRIAEQQDIDTAISTYAEQFFKEFLTFIPRDVSVDRATLLKFIKQFYRAKGTEKSYKFFFRMLYNINVDFYYPRVDILRASDGKWIQPKTLRVIPVQGDITQIVSQKIRGLSKNCTAFVDRMFGVQEGPLFGYELFLNRSSITGVFLPNEIIEAEVPNSETGEIQIIQARISPVPIKIDFIDRGANYQIGQEFNIFNGANRGFGGRVRIEKVGPSGEILKIRVVSYGLDYDLQAPAFIDFSQPDYTPPIYGMNVEGAGVETTDSIKPAKGVVVFGSTTEYPGYYLNEDGQLSTSKYLHDGEFYQQFSYVTFVNESLNQYKEIVKRLIHPVGLKHFGGVRVQNLLKIKLKNPKNTNFPVKRTVQNELWAKLRIKTAHALHHEVLKSQESLSLGRNNYSIYRDRFNYKPFEKYDANQEMPTLTEPYWGVYGDLKNQKAITPIKSFGHLKPCDVERTQRGKKNNIMSDAVVETGTLVQDLEDDEAPTTNTD